MRVSHDALGAAERSLSQQPDPASVVQVHGPYGMGSEDHNESFVDRVVGHRCLLGADPGAGTRIDWAIVPSTDSGIEAAHVAETERAVVAELDVVVLVDKDSSFYAVGILIPLSPRREDLRSRRVQNRR